MPNKYETVFIVKPAFSAEQAKEVVGKFRKLLKDIGANILQEESWGAKKSTGYYQLFEYVVDPRGVAEIEMAFKRDERVLRFMTVMLDK